MKSLLRKLSQEAARFKILPPQTRALFFSISVRTLVSPFFSLFVNAFLWKAGANIFSLAIYNLSFFCLIPVGFYLNGLLARKIAPSKIYSASMIAEGLLVTTLFFSHQTDALFLLEFGLAYGIIGGFYWGNRNFLELSFVPDAVRNYFYATYQAVSMVIKIAIPFCIGWFIVYAEKSKLLATPYSYQLLMLLALGALIWAGSLFARYNSEIPRFQKLLVRQPTPLWNKIRLLSFLIGFTGGVNAFLPTLMILYLVGREGALGTVSSIAALAGALCIYIIGRRSKQYDRPFLAIVGISLLIIGAIIFIYAYSTVGVIIYSMALTLYGMLLSASHDPILYRAIEQDDATEAFHYARLCDREIFLNIGRLLGGALFIGLLLGFSSDTSLHFTPLILAIIQIPLLFLIPRIAKNST